MSVGKILGQYELFQKKFRENSEQLAHLGDRRVLLHSTSTILAEVANKVQHKNVTLIESLVSRALQSIFDRPDYRFTIELSESRGRILYECKLSSSFRSDEISCSILDGHGGGIHDIIAFICRVAVIVLTRAPRVIILDEPFKFAHLGSTKALGRFLRQLCNELDFQIILVSANQEFQDFADVCYLFQLNENQETVIKEVSGAGLPS